jgi:hypothetical protein
MAQVGATGPAGPTTNVVPAYTSLLTAATYPIADSDPYGVYVVGNAGITITMPHCLHSDGKTIKFIVLGGRYGSQTFSPAPSSSDLFDDATNAGSFVGVSSLTFSSSSYEFVCSNAVGVPYWFVTYQ